MSLGQWYEWGYGGMTAQDMSRIIRRANADGADSDDDETLRAPWDNDDARRAWADGSVDDRRAERERRRHRRHQRDMARQDRLAATVAVAASTCDVATQPNDSAMVHGEDGPSVSPFDAVPASRARPHHPNRSAHTVHPALAPHTPGHRLSSFLRTAELPAPQCPDTRSAAVLGSNDSSSDDDGFEALFAPTGSHQAEAHLTTSAGPASLPPLPPLSRTMEDYSSESTERGLCTTSSSDAFDSASLPSDEYGDGMPRTATTTQASIGAHSSRKRQREKRGRGPTQRSVTIGRGAAPCMPPVLFGHQLLAVPVPRCALVESKRLASRQGPNTETTSGVASSQGFMCEHRAFGDGIDVRPNRSRRGERRDRRCNTGCDGSSTNSDASDVNDAEAGLARDYGLFDTTAQLLVSYGGVAATSPSGVQAGIEFGLASQRRQIAPTAAVFASLNLSDGIPSSAVPPPSANNNEPALVGDEAHLRGETQGLKHDPYHEHRSLDNVDPTTLHPAVWQVHERFTRILPALTVPLNVTGQHNHAGGDDEHPRSSSAGSAGDVQPHPQLAFPHARPPPPRYGHAACSMPVISSCRVAGRCGDCAVPQASNNGTQDDDDSSLASISSDDSVEVSNDGAFIAKNAKKKKHASPQQSRDGATARVKESDVASLYPVLGRFFSMNGSRGVCKSLHAHSSLVSMPGIMSLLRCPPDLAPSDGAHRGLPVQNRSAGSTDPQFSTAPAAAVFGADGDGAPSPTSPACAQGIACVWTPVSLIDCPPPRCFSTLVLATKADLTARPNESQQQRHQSNSCGNRHGDQRESPHRYKHLPLLFGGVDAGGAPSSELHWVDVEWTAALDRRAVGARHHSHHQQQQQQGQQEQEPQAPEQAHESAPPPPIVAGIIGRAVNVTNIAAGFAPAPRYGHTMTAMPSDRGCSRGGGTTEVLVFGGVGQGRQYLHDCFILDTAALLWREVELPYNFQVPCRAFHTAAFAPFLRSVIFCGGEVPGLTVGAAWEYCPKAERWSIVSPHRCGANGKEVLTKAHGVGSAAVALLPTIAGDDAGGVLTLGGWVQHKHANKRQATSARPTPHLLNQSSPATGALRSGPPTSDEDGMVGHGSGSFSRYHPPAPAGSTVVVSPPGIGGIGSSGPPSSPLSLTTTGPSTVAFTHFPAQPASEALEAAAVGSGTGHPPHHRVGRPEDSSRSREVAARLQDATGGGESYGCLATTMRTGTSLKWLVALKVSAMGIIPDV